MPAPSDPAPISPDSSKDPKPTTASPANKPVPSKATSGRPLKKTNPPATPHGFWFRRRAVPVPTWRFTICALLTLAALALIVGKNVHPWLAVSSPVPDAKFIAVEGWSPDYVLSATVNLAEESQATRVFTTGIPLERGSFLMSYKTYADVAANVLAKLGLDPQRICPVPCADIKSERTRAMATALKAVLDHEPVPDTGRRLNLVTLGTHARRSHAIFKDVFGPDWQIGVISIPSVTYDADEWWKASEGAKNVMNELSGLALMGLGKN